jgi:hypothetical protein
MRFVTERKMNRVISEKSARWSRQSRGRGSFSRVIEPVSVVGVRMGRRC